MKIRTEFVRFMLWNFSNPPRGSRSHVLTFSPAGNDVLNLFFQAGKQTGICYATMVLKKLLQNENIRTAVLLKNI